MNPTLASALILIACLLIGYLFGTIPTGVILSKTLFRKDVRTEGSHNSGGTNVARVFGKKYGVAVIIIDMIKTVLPVYAVWAVMLYSPLGQYAFAEMCLGYGAFFGGIRPFYWIAGLGAAVGHCFPFYLHFKGGKAVSSFMGINVLTSWVEFVVSGFGYLYLAKKSKYISYTSLIIAGVGTGLAWIIFLLQIFIPFYSQMFGWTFGFTAFPQYGLEFALCDTLVAALLVVRHRSNIKRLKAGTESKNPFLSGQEQK